MWIDAFLRELPLLHGNPIRLQFLPALTAHGGALFSGDAGRGRPVYAASFLRERRMVIEDSLARRAADLRLILAHELFHFAWWRLGNRSRGEFDGLLREELTAGARGELGESAAVAKSAYARRGIASSSSSWKQYTCESFCDTAAWLYAGVDSHKCFQLAARWREKRGSLFKQLPPFRV